MTDPLATIRERIDAGQRRFRAASDMLTNTEQYRQQADRLGFPIDVREENGRVLLSFPTPDLAPMDNRHLDDARKPWPAVRDDYQPPANDEPAPAPEVDCAHETTARVHSTGETECVSCKAPVEPEPASVPRALPPIKDHLGKPVAPAAKRAWTLEDNADLITRFQRGESAKEIAEATDRAVASVNGKIGAMRVRGLLKDPELDAVPPGPERSEVTIRPPEPVADRPVPKPIEVTASAAVIEAQTDDPDDEADFWTPARKLALTECLLRGTKMAAAADEVGCSTQEARAQWSLLYPGSGLDDQQKLLRRLRADVATVPA